jgi:hypothetical protein
MESFISEYTTKHKVDGKQFFDDVVFPAAKAWKEFRDGHTRLIGLAQDPPSLFFLGTSTQISTVKEIGIVILDLLVMHRNAVQESPRLQIENRLRKIESVALWMMLAKPKPKVRLERCLEIVKQNRNGNAYELGKALSLSSDEKVDLLHRINCGDFGATAVENKKAKAILERINEYISVTEHQHRGHQPLFPSQLHLEHVLPQNHENVPEWAGDWEPEHVQIWLHKLGNLALLNEKANASIGNSAFEKKQASLEKSPYPLTQQISRENQWSVTEVENHHKKIVDYAREVWNL